MAEKIIIETYSDYIKRQIFLWGFPLLILGMTFVLYNGMPNVDHSGIEWFIGIPLIWLGLDVLFLVRRIRNKTK